MSYWTLTSLLLLSSQLNTCRHFSVGVCVLGGLHVCPLCLILKVTASEMNDLTSGQDGGEGRHTVPPQTTKIRTTTNFKKQLEPTENQTVWKSDNQGVKEETLIQTCRRGRDGQQADRTHG